jgi:hypothetical protein
VEKVRKSNEMIVIETMREQLFSLQAINLRISDEMFNTQNYNLKQMQASFRISTYRLLPVKYDKYLLIIKLFSAAESVSFLIPMYV